MYLFMYLCTCKKAKKRQNLVRDRRLCQRFQKHQEKLHALLSIKIGGGVVLIKMNHIPLTFLKYNNIYILMKLKEVKQDIHTKSKRKC